MPREHDWHDGICERCGARSDWPLSKQPCGGGSITLRGKLSGADYVAIKRAYHDGTSAMDLAERFGVSWRHIYRIAGPRQPRAERRAS